jgi:hypothetical protein
VKSCGLLTCLVSANQCLLEDGSFKSGAAAKVRTAAEHAQG